MNGGDDTEYFRYLQKREDGKMENKELMAEPEVVETEIETAPDSGGLIAQTKDGIDDLIYLGDNINKIVDAQNKIRLGLLRLAQPGDWVVFGDNGDAKAELGFAGANRIGSTLGVSFTNWTAQKLNDRDDNGEWYRWEYEADAIYRGRTVRVWGRAGSRDKFFGKSHGAYRPLHEIDEGNIKAAARRSCMKEGIKVLFGLHHMDPKFLTGNGISLVSASGHSFKSQEQKAESALEKMIVVEIVTVKQGDGWKKFTVKTKANETFGTFSETVAKEADKVMKEKSEVKVVYKSDEKYGNTIISLNGVVGESKKG